MIPASNFKPADWIAHFGVRHGKPGRLYVLRSDTRLKIGQTKNIDLRLKAARTWIPDIEIIGVKPFWYVTNLERCLHIALTDFWIGGEWFDFGDDEFKDYFIETFEEFHDNDINKNSVDFIYWMNSSGMSEFTLEFGRRSISLPEWRRQDGGR